MSRAETALMNVERYQLLGQNEEWYFVIARMDGRWVGGALGRRLVDGRPHFIVFQKVAEGHTLGLVDRVSAARRTLAVARAPEKGWGPVHAPPELKVRPAKRVPPPGKWGGS